MTPPPSRGRRTPQEGVGRFPDLVLADVAAALDYARDLADFEAAVVP